MNNHILIIDDDVKLTDLIKTYLQNQKSAPSGIGNYLACEICHQARLSPFKKIKSLSKKHYEMLIQAIQSIHKICMSRSDYNWFCVYHKTHCGTCNNLITHQKHTHKNSQTTWWCRACTST